MRKQNRNKIIKSCALHIAFALIAISIYTGIIYAINPLVLHNSGTIQTSPEITSDVTAMAWGTLVPGEVKTMTVNFKATNGETVTISYTTANWLPTEAATFMSISWDYLGQEISTNWFPVTFTLAVSQDIIDISNFTYDIMVTAT